VSGMRRGPRLSAATGADTSVFINCPYDDGYRPLADAIVLAAAACGFTARSAIETGTVSVPRIDRIRSAISGSRYSIHDLSRCRGQGDADLARFNMPLELGFAMWRRFTDEVAHDWLVLVPEGHEYLKFISDLGAFDPKTHQGTLETVVPPVVNWLKTRQHAGAFPFPDQVIDRLPAYLNRIATLRNRSGGELPWSELVATAEKHARGWPRRATVL
jgi:hypothetical protein